MKVQTKILLLLIALVVVFLGGIWQLQRHEAEKVREVTQARAAESRESFNRRLEKRGESLQNLANDYTYWDGMVLAVESSDRAWLATNLTEASTLDRFGADAVWVYRSDKTSLYEVNRLYAGDGFERLPLPAAAFEQIVKRRKDHFFLSVPPHGLIEIRAATIHLSADSQREGPPHGFLFAGRLWTDAGIAEAGLPSNAEHAWIAPPGEALPRASTDDALGVTEFAEPLPGWDGKPVAQIMVRSEWPIVGELTASSRQLVWALLIFAATLLLVLGVSLFRLVGNPLRLLSESLRRGDVAPIALLKNKKGEFGGFARLIYRFFEQRASLMREIEERKLTQEALARREEELRHSQKMEAVGRLAGGVAHDFNNLLTAIIGYSELLAKRLDGDSVGQQNAHMILKAGQQAAAVTHQLLAFSRKQILQPKVIDLNAVVAGLQLLLRRTIGEHIELITRPEAAHGRVRADPNQIEQVILNLGVNARDAMPRGGHLTIATSMIKLLDEDTRPEAADLPSGDYVLLLVSDTGCGMDPETRARIFEPFFTTKGPGQGTGLGLATVYGIISQSGGAVTVDSTVGKGTTFRIYLPAASGPVDPPSSVPPPADPARDAETVLVVEDEEIVRDLVCFVLREKGYHVLCAPDGNEALAMMRAERRPIHLLITDVVMPQMNGPELVSKLSALRPELRVLYVSGYSENDISAQGILDAAVKFLEKPFTPQMLARKVREVLDEPAPATPSPGGRDGHSAEALARDGSELAAPH